MTATWTHFTLGASMFTIQTKIAQSAAGMVAVALIASGCSGGSNMPSSGSQSTIDANENARPHRVAGRVLPKETQEASRDRLDPRPGERRAKSLRFNHRASTNGAFTAGDLVVCNFNAKSNVQGTGKSIIALHPTPGSNPTHVSSDATLKGCDALALSPGDTIWAAAMVANDNPVLDPSGGLIQNIKGKPFKQPWGQVFAQPTSGSPAFYATNAGTGTVVRINLGSQFTYDVIGKASRSTTASRAPR